MKKCGCILLQEIDEFSSQRPEVVLTAVQIAFAEEDCCTYPLAQIRETWLPSVLLKLPDTCVLLRRADGSALQ